MKQINRDENAPYYPSFDYLRFTLATIVAIGHSGIPVWVHSGDLSVQIFFALSGWLIGGILLRSTLSELPRFYYNRAARIWIPYAVAIALLLTASLLKEPITAKWLETVFYYVTFVYNYFGPPQLTEFAADMPLDGTGNHFWSICAEEQFYLIAPFLVLATPNGMGRSIWFWALIAIATNASPFWNYFGSISLGVLAAVAKVHIGAWHHAAMAKFSLAAISVFIFALTYLDQLDYRLGAPTIAICIVLLLAKTGKHSPIAQFVGGMSYPMYLNHWIGVFIANAAFGKFGLKVSLICQISGILISLAVAAALYVIIDRFVRHNRDRFFTAARGKCAAFIGFGLVLLGLTGGIVLQ